jgi:hypothetical protein
MRRRVIVRVTFLSAFILGIPAGAIAQGGPRASLPARHQVSVVVPVILTLVPPEPGSSARAWQVRTNDPTLRRRLQKGATIQGAGDTVRVTLAPP